MPKQLKIVCIVGCLEPGHDGVGDYTHRLARLLFHKGHSCLLIALKDPFVSKPIVHSPKTPNTPYTTLRFQDVRNSKRYLSETIHSFQPDCISLQFVPYAFHKYGLPLYLANLLKPFSKQYSFHVLMHEIWIGFEAASSLKHRLIGKLQRLCIQSIFRALQPKVIHTHTRIYKDYLQALHPRVGLVPLFSAIPYSGYENSLATCLKLLSQKGLALSSQHRSSYWIGAFFGALYPEWPPEPLLQMLARTSHTHQKRLIILHFGHIGRGAPLWQQLEKDYSSAFTFFKLGPLSPQQIELLLQHIDFGIATSPLHLLEKSASALAFLEWGCPLIVNRIEKDTTLSPFFEDRILKINTPDFESRLSQAQRKPYSSQAEEAFLQFLKALDSIQSPAL